MFRELGGVLHSRVLSLRGGPKGDPTGPVGDIAPFIAQTPRGHKASQMTAEVPRLTRLHSPSTLLSPEKLILLASLLVAPPLAFPRQGPAVH